MTVALPTDTLVIEATEAECRQVMARRAALPDVWQHRKTRRQLRADVNRLLDSYNLLTLGR